MILNQSGFEARPVYSGEGALELVPTFAPDMLISDVIMADLNGIDAAIRIKALLPGIKVLLFSGQAATADLLEKARAQGYEFEILAKPVHPQDLLKTAASSTGPFGTAVSRKNFSIIPAGVNAMTMRPGFSPAPEKQWGMPRGPSTDSPGPTRLRSLPT